MILFIIFYLSFKCFYSIRLNFTNTSNACELCFDIYFYCPRINEDIVSSTKVIKDSLKPILENDSLNVCYLLYFNMDYFLL